MFLDINIFFFKNLHTINFKWNYFSYFFYLKFRPMRSGGTVDRSAGAEKVIFIPNGNIMKWNVWKNATEWLDVAELKTRVDMW